MPQVIYVQPDGARQAVDAAAGTSVMRAAIHHGVPGIVAECGGSLMCATCHVYVDPALTERLPPISAEEDEMLEVTAAIRTAVSRLSCQLGLTEGLDGLVVHVPETQS